MGRAGSRIKRSGRVVVGACVLALALGVLPAGTAGAQSDGPVTIPIGHITSIDSPVISFPDYAAALKASVKAYNKRNPDVKFKLFVCDDKFDPNLSVDCARQMVERGVVATVGDVASGNPAGVDTVLKEAGIPRIGLSMLSLPEFGSEVSYPLSSGPILASGASGFVFADHGGTKVKVLVGQSPQAGAIAGLLKPALDKAGVEVVETVIFPEGTTDYSSYVSQAASDSDGIICVCTPQQGVPVATAAAQLGLDVPLNLIVLGFSLDEIVGSGYKDWALVDSFPPPEKVNVKAFPGLKQFLADMKAAKDKTLAPGKLKSGMIQSWLALHAITELTKGDTEVTAASLKAELDSAKDIDMLGIIPPWTPSLEGPGLFTAVSNPTVYRVEFKKNKLVATRKDPIDLYEIFN